MAVEPAKLTQYIKDLGLSYHETSKSFMFTCPLCGGEEKLYIRKSDGRFRCFKCCTENGFSGNVEFAIIELTNIPLKVVRQSLYGNEYDQSSYLDLKLKDFFDEEDFDDEEIKAEVIPELTWPYTCIPILDPGAVRGLEYLQSRGIPPDIADCYKIRYSPRERAVVFPAYVRGKLLGWQYRTIDPTRVLVDDVVIERPKAWSSTNLPRDKIFMFADRLIGSEVAVICEGPIDAIKAHKVGGNVAAMGKSISFAHVATVLRHGVKKIYAGIDPDAFAELEPLMEKLGNEASLYYVKVPERRGKKKTDLGDLSIDDAYRVIMSSEKMQRNRLYMWIDPSFLGESVVG
jgi:hypothetical protein